MAEQEILVEIPPLFTLYKDGSVRRSSPGPLQPPTPEFPQDGVASKDLTHNADLGLWARIFLPPHPPHHKLPLVLFFHGGAFLFGSPAWAHIHHFCADMASRTPAIWVSASYRLAPEHRLPAAFDDGYAAILWLRSQALLQSEGKVELVDAWLGHADFSRCFLAGESAGSITVHQVAMRAMEKPMSWAPLCIRGLVLIHPGFIRGTRTQEETECPTDIIVNWSLVDTFMGLSLPVGANKDHVFFNPLLEISASDRALFARFPRTFVAMADKDVGHYLGLAYCEALRQTGCCVKNEMSIGVGHLFYYEQADIEQTQVLKQKISMFIAE